MTAQRQARQAALQVLYFCEIARVAADEALAAVFTEHLADAGPKVRSGAARLVHGTLAEIEPLDALVSRHSEHWRIERLAVIDRLILRMAAWELLHEPETPAAVVINEAIELARTFSSDQSVKFVNGVLDAIRKTVEKAPGPRGRSPSE
jgi:transcription antitermination protein NusB